MIDGSRKLPTQHITIRVPWHDSGWNGSVCNNPCGNTSCMVLPRIGASRDDDYETEVAGQSIETMERAEYPPCVDEHSTVMAAFNQSMIKHHPYSESSPDSHGHMTSTPYTIQQFSAAAIPFRWMLINSVEGEKKLVGKAEALQLGYQAEREPKMKFDTSWVQEGQNQRIMLDTFFGALQPKESIVFFYAKRTPLSDDGNRVIVGVGKVLRVGDATEYRYVNDKPKSAISGYLWERNVEHSIRPSGGEGFIFPYQKLVELADKDSSIDVEACTAYAPPEYFEKYSYGSELIEHDGAIASLLACEKAIIELRKYIDAPWDEYLAWIDKELNNLWEIRGAFPGLGAALNAFGFQHGNLLAWYVSSRNDDSETFNPWKELDEVLSDTSSLPDYLRSGIGETFLKKWTQLNDKRRALLILVSRFNLTDSQALRWYQTTERSDAKIFITDDEILENPYFLYEADRLKADAIAFDIIDRGMFPPKNIRDSFPIPEPSLINEAIDKRRVRAVILQTLEEATEQGHTLLPGDWLIKRVRSRAMKPECPIDEDLLPLFDEYLSAELLEVELNDSLKSYQLNRYVETSELIRTAINKRLNGKPNSGEWNWLDQVNKALDGNNTLSQDELEKRARREKAVSLEMLFKSRICVLMGSAGTGKSTLLKALCNIKSVSDGGILLLAPTGKARVRLEQTSGLLGQGKTIAQFLNGLQRYDGSTGRYYINKDAARSSSHKTVVVDEASMLTEEQLAALLDSLKGVTRFILVGDPKQLPPIGAGRPYVDIVKALEPENVDSLFPKVSNNYAELTVTRRQIGDDENERVDILLADYFSGRPMDAGADEVWHTVSNGKTPYIKLVKWDQPNNLKQKLISELTEELKLKSDTDGIGFETSLGGTASDYKGKQYMFFNTAYGNKPGAAKSAENWQVLTPIRATEYGVDAVNRFIQAQFRKDAIDLAARTGYMKRIPSPAGPQGVIWGDKVINVINSGRRKTYPKKDNQYVANGDIGIVVGHYKTKKKSWSPKEIEVELSSQPGLVYKYWPSEFTGLEFSPPLELAYALTVHKAQGSEFGTTFLIIPNPCRLLTREMLYTALTRHRGKVVILHQGDFRDLKSFSHEEASEITKRMTNLFIASEPQAVLVKNKTIFLDKNLIYRTDKGDLVRSKSEWIIADKLHNAGVDYIYEQTLNLGGVDRYPDFTIVDDDSGISWYWEHNGLMNNDLYKKRWARKLTAYRAAGILPHEEGGGENGTLLVTEENEGIGLNAEKIKEYIQVISG
jgi:energy-coupling factor transporter ATP-binding protein EcfA2